jgi:hypothetical protein
VGVLPSCSKFVAIITALATLGLAQQEHFILKTF